MLITGSMELNYCLVWKLDSRLESGMMVRSIGDKLVLSVGMDLYRVVETSDGKLVRRNRRYLQVIPDAIPRRIQFRKLTKI